MESREKETLQKSQRINRWCAQKLYYCAGKRHQRSWTVKRGEVYFTDLGQIKTIGKERIVGEKICMLKGEIKEVDRKLLNVFGLVAIIKSKENVIKSLQGKIEYIKMQK